MDKPDVLQANNIKQLITFTIILTAADRSDF